MRDRGPSPSGSHEQLLVCGWDDIGIWELSPAAETLPHKIWTWRAQNRADIPTDLWELFRPTAECKPYESGRKILMTSSGGAVALIDREQDRVVFYARAANAHSADLLPHNRLAVACSHRPDGSGDRVLLFDLAVSDRVCFSTEVPWAHGVVWDADRQRVYVLAKEDLRVYALVNWASATPQLALLATMPFPDAGHHTVECGHDLYAVPGTAWLSVTTEWACWYFDRDTQTFLPHSAVSDLPYMKSLTHHPHGGTFVYVQAEAPNWWAERIHVRNPDRVMYVPGEHFYKARWNVQTAE